jgi:hypothetical protein
LLVNKFLWIISWELNVFWTLTTFIFKYFSSWFYILSFMFTKSALNRGGRSTTLAEQVQGRERPKGNRTILLVPQSIFCYSID